MTGAQNIQQKTAKFPVSDIDPFADDFLRDPYPYYEAIRAIGPVVKLSRYDVWGLTDYQPVHSILADWQTFCSSRGVGLADFGKEKPWRPPSLLLETDPPEHTRARNVVARILSARAVRELRDGFQEEADALLDELLELDSFDAVERLARAFPLKVFPDAVGIGNQGRDNLLAYGALAFNAFGPHNHVLQKSLATSEPVVAWIAEHCELKKLSPGGFGTQVYDAIETGEITEDEAPRLVRSFLTAGVDTTVHGLGAAIWAFAENRDQWLQLHSDPSLARRGFEEVLRYTSPVQTFFRTCVKPVNVGGMDIGDGDKVLLFLGAANRDPKRWKDPDRFDINRNATGHVGFGNGIHQCVGQMIARLEAEVLLGTMARKVKSIEPLGEPVWGLNNTLRGLASFAVKLVAA
jgi:cytochrome P450